MNHIADRPDFDEFDEIRDPRDDETDFAQIAERALSRRMFLGGGVALGATALVMGTTALTPLRAEASSRLGFEQVGANSLDTVTVPRGYRRQIVARWGDPL